MKQKIDEVTMVTKVDVEGADLINRIFTNSHRVIIYLQDGTEVWVSVRLPEDDGGPIPLEIREARVLVETRGGEKK